MSIGQLPEPYVVPFTVLIDTGEGAPWTFRNLMGDVQEKGWPRYGNKGPRPLVVHTKYQALGRHPNSYGDYSIEGHQGKVCIERKSLEDIQGTILGWETESQTGRRIRFEKELENLNKDDLFSIVIVEAEFDEVLSQMPSHGVKSVAENRLIFERSVLSYQQRFHRVQWAWRAGVRQAEIYAFRWMARYYRKWQAAYSN